MNNDAAKNTALAGIAGIGVLGLSGWAAVIYAAYQYGKGNNGRALTSLGAGVVAFIAARAVAKKTVSATKAALAVQPNFAMPQRQQPRAAPQPQPMMQGEEEPQAVPPEYSEDVASVYDMN